MQEVKCPDCPAMASVKKETLHGRVFVTTKCPKCGHISTENKTAKDQMANPFYPYTAEDFADCWIV